MVVLDTGLLSVNSGGTVAHIEGYLSGYFYAKQFNNGKILELLRWYSKLF